MEIALQIKHDNPLSENLISMELLAAVAAIAVGVVAAAAAAAAAVAAPVENHMEIAIEFELKNGGGHDASLTESFFIKTVCSKKLIFIFCLTCLKYMEICYRI